MQTQFAVGLWFSGHKKELFFECALIKKRKFFVEAGVVGIREKGAKLKAKVNPLNSLSYCKTIDEKREKNDNIITGRICLLASRNNNQSRITCPFA
jgi:predicted RNA-binding protein